MSNWNSIIISFFSGKYEMSGYEDCRKYRTLGNYDFLAFSPMPDGKSSVDDMLSYMWSRSNKISLDLKPGQSAKSLFAFDHTECANAFWEGDRVTYPYIFVSLIQTCGGEHEKNIDKIKEIVTEHLAKLPEYEVVGDDTPPSDDKELTNKLNELSDFAEKARQYGLDLDHQMLDKIESLKNEAAGVIKTAPGIKCCIYTALDSCDLILCMKSMKYEEGLNVIIDLNNDRFSRYIYSMIGMSLEDVIKAEEEEYVDKIGISAITIKMQYYDDWRVNIQKTLKVNGEDLNYVDRLGDEDIYIAIRNYSLKTLARQLDEENLLKPGDAFPFPRLRIVLDSFERVSAKYDGNDSDLSSVFKDFDDSKYAFLDHIHPATQKALMEMITVCQCLEEWNFAVDTRACIGYFLPAVIAQAKAFDSVIFGEPDGVFNYTMSKIDKNQFKKSVLLFVSGMRTIIDGTLNSDRMFFQVPGINAELYNIPAKLLSFYTYFVGLVTDVLKSPDKAETKYRFLLCPDLYDKMQFERLFHYGWNKNVPKILKVRVPVDMLFQPKNLMMELSHETAHAVGSLIRRRVERREKFGMIILDFITEELVRPPAELHDFAHVENLRSASAYLMMDENHVIIKEIRAFLEEHWYKRCEQYSTYKAGKTELESGDENSRAVVEKTFKIVLDKLFSDKLWELLSLVNNVLRRRPEKEYLENNEDVRRLILHNAVRLTNNELHNIVDVSGLLLYESLADLVLIYILKIPVMEYVGHIHAIVEKSFFSYHELAGIGMKVVNENLHEEAAQAGAGSGFGEGSGCDEQVGALEAFNIGQADADTDLSIKSKLADCYRSIFNGGFIRERIKAVIEVAYEKQDGVSKLSPDAVKTKSISFQAFVQALDINHDANAERKYAGRDPAEHGLSGGKVESAGEAQAQGIATGEAPVQSPAGDAGGKPGQELFRSMLPASAEKHAADYLRVCQIELDSMGKMKKDTLELLQEYYMSIDDDIGDMRIENFIRKLKTANSEFIERALYKKEPAASADGPA